MSRAIALTLVLAVVVAAGVLAGGSSGASHRRYTVVYATDSQDPRVKGARMAAKRLGVRFVLPCDGCSVYDVIGTKRHHPDAIASDGYDPTLRPIYRQIRKAGTLLVSSGDDISAKRDVWVSYSGRVAFARALADSLASQIDGTGEYAILEEQHQYPVADTWEKDVESYIPKAYPSMKLDGVLNLTGAGDQAEADAIESFISAHPNLKGLIGIVPTEAYLAAQAITQAGKVGQIFSAGNGGDALNGTPLVGWIQSGAMEDVIGGDPVKLGYLTVWAAHHLLTGHRFKRGVYRLREWGLRVSYFPEHRELRLGRPLTITQANLAAYLG